MNDCSGENLVFLVKTKHVLIEGTVPVPRTASALYDNAVLPFGNYPLWELPQRRGRMQNCKTPKIVKRSL